MSQELSAAGDQLLSVLDRYVRACSSARDACLGGGGLNSSPELLRSLEKESNSIATYIRRLEDAGTSVNAARSSISSVTPITTLPAEILARIFYSVLPGQSCIVRRGHLGIISKIQYPPYPDNLVHVCSYWRRVAITTPSLWTHIDIALDHSLNPGLFARAKVYATRAGRLPLEIHISDPGSEREAKHSRATQRDGTMVQGHPYTRSHEWGDLHDFKILASTTARIKTLEMDLYIHSRYREIYYSILEYFFARSKPDVLTQYIVRCANNYSVDNRPFIEPAEAPQTRNGSLLMVCNAHLEELWLRIPIVRVNGLCPHWESKAYHGLVELYIDSGVPDLSELQLINILRSSPKLQVFRLTTAFDELIDDGLIHNPVYLEDLRDLNILIHDDETTSTRILGQIIPGSKPLQLSLSCFSVVALVDFCSRVNVTRFYVWGPPQLTSFFNQCPRLEILVVNEHDLDTRGLRSIIRGVHNADFSDSDGEDEPADEPIPTSATQINTLYLLGYLGFAFEEIQAVVEKHSVQQLFIYNGELSYQTDDGRSVCDNTRNIRAKLSTITNCPKIEYYPDGYPNGFSEGGPIDPEDWIRTSLRF